MGKDNLGDFEHQVLLAMLRLGPGAYSVPIVAELEERTGREVAHPAVYIALRRLEENGIVTSQLKRPDGDGARSRRYFEVTEQGVQLLRESKRRFVSLWEGLDPILEKRS